MRCIGLFLGSSSSPAKARQAQDKSVYGIPKTSENPKGTKMRNKVREKREWMKVKKLLKSI